MPAYHRRININGKELKPLVICKLGSGSNLPGYYMYHGGTNPYNPLHTMGETQAPVARLYSFTVSEEVLRELKMIMKEYMAYYVHHDFKSLSIFG